jgi:hypothetical protein
MKGATKMDETQRVPMEPISSLPQIDERRALIMSLQAMLDPTMLKVIAALHAGERSLPELAQELKVQPSFSHGPLGRLIFLEIVAVRNVDGRLLCRLNHERLRFLNGALQRLSRDLFADKERHAALDADASIDAEDKRVLRGFVRGERLIQIPAGPERLQPVLRWLAAKFEPGRRYPERELNELLKRHHEDFATLRRSLVDFRYMERADGVYWLRETPPAEW